MTIVFKFKRKSMNPLIYVGGTLLFIVILAGLLAPFIAPHDPNSIHLDHKLSPPSFEYPLGTDGTGRCVFSRILYGMSGSVLLPMAAMGIMILISIPMGLLAGYCGNWVDRVVMFVVNTLLSFPGLLLAIVVAGFLGPGRYHMLFAVVIVGWANYARLVRGLTLSLIERPFIAASRRSGASAISLMFRHILPNITSTLLIYAALDIGGLILSLSGLSFLGLGAAPPSPDWGTMLSDGRNYIQTAPQLLVYPGIAIVLVSLGCNLVAEGLRDKVDARLR